MIQSRGRKIIGDVLSRKGRTAMVAIAIMIGVFGVTTLVSMNDLVVSQLNNDLQVDHIAMTHAYMVLPGGPQLSLADNQPYLDLLSELPGVELVEAQAIYRATWRRADDDRGESAQFERSNVLAYSEPFGEVQLEPVSRVVEGRYPETGNHEIAVEQRFAEQFDLSVDDKLVFLPPPGAPTADDAEPVEWEIVGLVFHPYFTISIVDEDSITPDNSIFATYEDAQEITGSLGYNSFYAVYTDVAAAHAGLDDFLQTIASQTPYIPVFSFVDDPNNNFILGQVKNVTSVLNVLAAVSMIVSGFLVTNVVNTIILEQKRQIGVMKSLGATRWDNFVIYIGTALIYGVIGTVLGVILAVPVASSLARSLAPLALTMIEHFSVSTTGVLLGVVLGLLVPVIAALIPVFNGTRVSVLDAMTDIGISSNWGTSRLSRLIGALPLPITVRQALSNVAQKKGRLALTGITLTLAAAAYMGVTAVFTSLGDTIENLFDTFNYDLTIRLQQEENFDTMRDLVVNNIEGVEGVYPGYGIAVAIEGYSSPDPLAAGSNQLGASGIDPASPMIAFNLEEGTGWQDGLNRKGVIITRPLATSLDKGVGDTVVVSVGGTFHEYEILGIDSFPFDLIFFDWRELATIAGYVDDQGQPLPDSISVSLAGDPDIDQVGAVIRHLAEILEQNGISAEYSNQLADIDEETENLGLFAMIFNMTSAIMAAVGAVGLLATLSMAVFERQKEIGVMRSIGAGSTTIMVQFLVEGIMGGVLAWLMAVPLSYLLAVGLADSLGFGANFKFSYPPMVLVVGFVGIVIIATIASLWPSYAASRKSVSEILRYQ